jgi:iron complex transport system substrate-binding protein
MITIRPTLLLAAMLAFCAEPMAQLSLRDDMGRGVIVQKPPERIVTLAPFLTEMVYAAGAGDLLVGVDSLSVYPPEARSLPKVITGPRFSVGQLAPLKPDLVLAWRDGIGRDEVDQISAFGATVFVAQARSLDDVPRLLELIGRLTGRDALPAMARFETQLDRVRRDNAGKLRLNTFVEIWNRPLTTVSGNHFLTEALDICRADNVFSELSGFAPKITWEALNSKNPYVILGAGSASSPDEFRSNWALRPALAAVKAQRLVYVDDDSIQRPTPRTPEGIARLCDALDRVRTAWTEGAAQPGAEAQSPRPAPAAPSTSRPAAARPPAAAVPAPAAPRDPDPEPSKPRPPAQYGM